ncbi:hypothetical protein AHiyo8_21080 [Arthrobacter sp. Hiyo8]|nr:hypothetical protein AHiyo8_21080 [Arthrobacter sp. Hiyo8]
MVYCGNPVPVPGLDVEEEVRGVRAVDQPGGVHALVFRGPDAGDVGGVIATESLGGGAITRVSAVSGTAALLHQYMGPRGHAGS